VDCTDYTVIPFFACFIFRTERDIFSIRTPFDEVNIPSESGRRDGCNGTGFVAFRALSFLNIFQALSSFWIRFRIKHGPESGHTKRSTSEKAQHGSKRHSMEYSSCEDTDNSKESSSGKTSSHSQTRGKKRKHSKSHDPEEFKKSKPPTFNGEIKKGEEAKFWILGLKKYFKVHDYFENLKARIAIFNLNGKASIWWEDLRNVKGVHEKEFSWKQFDKYFKKKYLSEKYFDGKTKKLYELKLGQLTIDEYINKFLKLMRYVPYIKDEKVNMQQFISDLPHSCQDRIEFDEP
jgi:hypothetical protein